MALGSDFDGAMIPKLIGDASGLQNLFLALQDFGFAPASLRKIASENWLRVLRLSWSSAHD